MKRLTCLFLFIFFFSFNPMAHTAQIPTLRYITEESPPDNFTEKGGLKGVSTEVLHEIWKLMGVAKQPVEVLPWARAYREAQDIPNTVLFSIIRNTERE
jgi:polar amino acid transport system substrate-binding protein